MAIPIVVRGESTLAKLIPEFAEYRRGHRSGHLLCVSDFLYLYEVIRGYALWPIDLSLHKGL